MNMTTAEAQKIAATAASLGKAQLTIQADELARIAQTVVDQAKQLEGLRADLAVANKRVFVS
jgi:hypothetical protein